MIDVGYQMALRELFKRLRDESDKDHLPKDDVTLTLPPADIYRFGVKDGLSKAIEIVLEMQEKKDEPTP